MYRPRIIPVLLLDADHLVKSVKFKNYQYIGDAINAVRIFNELKADELVFLDISASKENRSISLEFVREVGEEADMPFAVGGGINSLDLIREVIQAGAEKVILGEQAMVHPEFVLSAAEHFGSSTISVCIDVKRNWLGKQQLCYRNATKTANYQLEYFAKLMEDNGAGELIIQSVTQDGMMKGYDEELIKKVVGSVSIPVVALGGAATYQDLITIYKNTGVNGMAAGSLFVYQGVHKGVLINYPDKTIKQRLYE
jgi:imidazole glycerol-phosphate synthase subunit HisF